jgi:hypothetical protein
MVLWHNADEVLDELSLHIDQGGDFFGILALQVGQQALEVEMHGVGNIGLKRLLVWHNEPGETIRHLVKDVGADETIVQQFLSPPCPQGAHLFASSRWPVNVGCCREAIGITIRYEMQSGSNEQIQ